LTLAFIEGLGRLIGRLLEIREPDIA